MRFGMANFGDWLQVVQRIGSNVAEIRRVRLVAHAAGIENDQKYSFHCLFLQFHSRLERQLHHVGKAVLPLLGGAVFVSQQMIGYRADGKRMACPRGRSYRGRSSISTAITPIFCHALLPIQPPVISPSSP